MKQLAFKEYRKGTKPHFVVKNKCYGGDIAYRKIARPVSTKSGMHVVLKSDCCGQEVSFRSKLVLDKILAQIQRQGQRFQVKVYKIAVVKNHIHMVVNPRYRHKFKSFLRAIAGSIALLMRRTFKMLSHIKHFWKSRPFTRVIQNHFDFLSQLKYLNKNILEAIGFVRYTIRKNKKYKMIQVWQNLSRRRKECVELVL